MSRRRKRSPRASPRCRALRTLIGTGAWMGPGGPSKSLRVHTGAFRPIHGSACDIAPHQRDSRVRLIGSPAL
ncbi:hypothetical protein K525DRAFT_277476 [Schizophyllum commune Loenen D]|nr:hypothetical protein K525DRAFT_277476 [Schizophyllum commune Loenen D]